MYEDSKDNDDVNWARCGVKAYKVKRSAADVTTPTTPRRRHHGDVTTATSHQQQRRQRRQQQKEPPTSLLLAEKLDAEVEVEPVEEEEDSVERTGN